MELVNATPMDAGYTLGLEADGRERVVVAVKGTFTLPPDGGEPRLAGEQAPLVLADEFTGEPGRSATRYECDLPPFKPRCDVLLNGSAHAPGGHPATHLTVGLRVATMAKAFQVVGARVWADAVAMVVPTHPEPFTRMPIGYDRAYGGTDVVPGDPPGMRAYPANPVGVGYYGASRAEELPGRPLASTEEIGDPATSPSGSHRPMSFGPIGRNVPSRIRLAGTYGPRWLDEDFPFLPPDFDPLYHQSAPPEQQIGYPRGGEEVELVNLTPSGRTRFRLPPLDLPVEFTTAAGGRAVVAAVVDTVILEPDLGRFMLVWRASHPLRRNLLEMRQCVVGWMPRGWYRARTRAKRYYPSLADLVAARDELAVERE